MLSVQSVKARGAQFAGEDTQRPSTSLNYYSLLQRIFLHVSGNPHPFIPSN